ncbi:carbohydrate-binding protein [Microbacterium gorillae]|uniref:carbohydrate-binding protein n=1 Tax=Microbacterium gorillae TaxID=1231063 RepID=UPI00058C2256|nr:carbohydrate-binding protein [Microbacterium gorillae]
MPVIRHLHPPRSRRAAIACAVATAALLTAGAAAPASATAPTNAEQHLATFLDHSASAETMAAAHLGAWRTSAENSVGSVQHAIDLNVAIAEIDLQMTSDDHLVVMHDANVSRTTTGSGNVRSHTLAEVTALPLKDLRGTTGAVTQQTVPSFDEILEVARDEILLNVDKAWQWRDEVYAAAEAQGMQRQIIFKSTAPIAEVNTFLAANEDALYCHVVNAQNQAAVLDAVAAGTFVRTPDCFEVIYANDAETQAQSAYLDTVGTNSRIWLNTLWRGLAGQLTDEATFWDESQGWGGAAAKGASIIQTDHAEALQHWIDTGSAASYDRPAGSVRVLAREYDEGGEGVAFHDTDSQDKGPGVDVCDQQRALAVCYIRAGEWIRYTIDLPTAGTYDIRARVASKAAGTGSFTLTIDTATTPTVSVRNTTGHDHFLMQDVAAGVHLSAGEHVVTFRVGSGNQNFNLDYLQFNPA